MKKYTMYTVHVCRHAGKDGLHQGLADFGMIATHHSLAKAVYTLPCSKEL
jgi:hypothetical protein